MKQASLDDFNNCRNYMHCPYCACHNTHIIKIVENDCRLPDSRQGNVAVELSCEQYPDEHTWIIGIVEHNGFTSLMQIDSEGEECFYQKKPIVN